MSEPRRPPEAQAVFFVDRCLGSGIVPKALRDAGLLVEILEDHFAGSEHDLGWLPEVGKRGWIVLTEDRHIKTRILELAALLAANTHVFILRPVQRLTGQQKAAALVAASRQMLQIASRTAPPLLATISPSGDVSELHGYAELQNQLRKLGWSP